MQHIEIKETFPFSVEQLFAFMERHENLEGIFSPIKITTIREGENERYGVGSVRRLQVAIEPPFEESITAYTRNELIEYKITKGSPLKDHHGIMRFTGTNTGSVLNYTIDFDSFIPFVAQIVRFFLERSIRKGLKKLQKTSL